MISGSMRLRYATEADIPGMHRIRLSVSENRLLDPSTVQPEDYRSMLGMRGRGWVAELNGEIAGFAIVDLSRANIWALFVDRASEGSGIGRALHDAMITWTFNTGIEQIWLGTEPGTRAERFYRAAGWKYVGLCRGEAQFELSSKDWRSWHLPPGS